MDTNENVQSEITVPALSRLILVKFEGHTKAHLADRGAQIEFRIEAANGVEQLKNGNDEFTHIVKVSLIVNTNAVFESDKSEFAKSTFTFEGAFLFEGIEPLTLKDALEKEPVLGYIMKSQVNAAGLVYIRQFLTSMGFNTDKLPHVML